MPTYNIVLEQVTIEMFQYWLEKEWDFITLQEDFVFKNEIELKPIMDPQKYECSYTVEYQSRLWGSIYVQKTRIDHISIEIFEFPIGEFSSRLVAWIQKKFQLNQATEEQPKLSKKQIYEIRICMAAISYKESGDTYAQFCRNMNIAERTLRIWKQRHGLTKVKTRREAERIIQERYNYRESNPSLR